MPHVPASTCIVDNIGRMLVILVVFAGLAQAISFPCGKIFCDADTFFIHYTCVININEAGCAAHLTGRGLGVIIGVPVGVIALCVMACVICCVYRRRSSHETKYLLAR